jgi:hypothetical protein
VSNFIFLKTDWPDLYETTREAEQNVASTPGSTPLSPQTFQGNLYQPLDTLLALC